MLQISKLSDDLFLTTEVKIVKLNKNPKNMIISFKSRVLLVVQINSFFGIFLKFRNHDHSLFFHVNNISRSQDPTKFKVI